MDTTDTEIFEKLIALEFTSIKDLLIKIFKYFTDKKYLRNTFDKTKYNHIDVTVNKKHNYHSLGITNLNGCVLNIDHFLRYIFSTIILNKNTTNDGLFAVVHHRDEYPGSIVEYKIKINDPTMNVIQSNFNRSNCYLKKFTTVKFKGDLLNNNFENLNEFVIDRIKELQNVHSDTKFTYNRDGKVIYNNRVQFDDHFKICETSVEAITNIVKLSFNNDFRSQCHGMLNVDNTYDMKYSLMENLLSVIHENYLFVEEISD